MTFQPFIHYIRSDWGCHKRFLVSICTTQTLFIHGEDNEGCTQRLQCRKQTLQWQALIAGVSLRLLCHHYAAQAGRGTWSKLHRCTGSQGLDWWMLETPLTPVYMPYEWIPVISNELLLLEWCHFNHSFTTSKVIEDATNAFWFRFAQLGRFSSMERTRKDANNVCNVVNRHYSDWLG